MPAHNATSDHLLSGALVAGAGVAGFLGARWLLGARAPEPPSPTQPPVAAATPQRPSASPVSSPAQVEPSIAASAVPVGALSRRFDPIFERYRGELPVEYLRALAMKETGLDPRAKNSAAWGLFQIIEAVRLDFNKAHKTAITRSQLLDPDVNTRVATWLLRLVVDNFCRHHADVPNLRPDWRNPRFVELLTFAWNAGVSESRGVGRVVRHLKEKGARDIDLDLVHQHARAAGASAHLANPNKARWSRGVAALYLRELGLTSSPTSAPVA